jgi:hypothetical protein
MNGNPLDNLRDIHLPQDVSWWPLAIGWWILIAMLLIAITYLTYYLIKRYRLSLTKRQAMQLLNDYQAAHQTHQDNKRLLSDYSSLIRRIVMSYYPREQLASVTGDAWLKQLNSLTDEAYFTDDIADCLISGPYQRQPIDAQQVAKVATQIERWLEAINRQAKPLERAHA